MPSATAVTTPAADTVAIDALLVAHRTARPATTLPSASFAVAVSVAVRPTMSSLAVGVTATVATGRTVGSDGSEESEHAISEAMIAE